MQNKIKNKIKIISLIFVSFIVIFCNCTPALADYFNNNDKANLKEKQLLEKIKIIHQVFPSQTDEAALLATLSHRGDLTSYITNSYEPDFDKKEYKQYMTNFKETAETVKNTDDGKYSQVNGDNTDILLAATIIMLDSSGWIGKYSDENYKKALAGNKLIGNMSGEGDIIANGFNAIFCGVGAAVDTATTPIQFGADFLQGQGDTAIARKASRYVTMTNVCTQGYIAGTYSSVRTLKDDERKQAIKDKYAEEIIKLAKEFRGENEDFCVVNPASNGDYTSWKQYGESWSDITMGDGTISKYGCLLTSIAIQIARSGTTVTHLPSGFSTFNPGAFVTSLKNNGGVDDSANFTGVGWEEIAANVKITNQDISSVTSTPELAKVLSSELSTGAENGQYQKYIVIRISAEGHSQHWIAVDSVTEDNVTLMDPGATGTTLDENYEGWEVSAYKVLYATDVPFGQGGTSTNTSSNYCGGEGIFPGHKYTDLTEDQLRQLAAVCIREQGSIEGAKFEASLMANLFELNGGSKYPTIYDYVQRSGWFGSNGFRNTQVSSVSDELLNAVKDVLVNGNRILPHYVNEHDCWDCNSSNPCGNGNRGDICYIEKDGVKYENMFAIMDHNNYIPDKTVVHNTFGSTYTFYAFPPEAGKYSDPFGYTEAAKTKITSQTA